MNLYQYLSYTVVKCEVYYRFPENGHLAWSEIISDTWVRSFVSELSSGGIVGESKLHVNAVNRLPFYKSTRLLTVKSLLLADVHCVLMIVLQDES